MNKPRRDSLVVIVSVFHAVGCGFMPGPGHTKEHYKNGTNCLHEWNTGFRVGV